MDIASLLGAAVGMLVGNPLTLVAGFVVSRLPFASARFWVELIVGMVLCIAAQIMFDQYVSDLPSAIPAQQWAIIIGLSVIIATFIFKGLRMLKEKLRPRPLGNN